MHSNAADGHVRSGVKPGSRISEWWRRGIKIRGDECYQNIVAGAIVRFHCRNELRCKIDNYFSSVKIF